MALLSKTLNCVSTHSLMADGCRAKVPGAISLAQGHFDVVGDGDRNLRIKGRSLYLLTIVVVEQ